MAPTASAHALAAALAAASRGLPVLPLTRGKLPAVPSPHRGEDDGPVRCRGECGRPGHGVHDATTDPGALRALFAAAPWATGYGIACGRAPLYLIGLDLDTKHGHRPLAALSRLAHRHGFTLPETVTVLTPTGGRHLWLRGRAGLTVPNSAGRLAPGIDVRGTGGYLVGPGSVTRHGTYRLAPGSAVRSPAAAPAALLHLMLPPPPPARRPRAGPGGSGGAYGHDGAALTGFVRRAPAGQRNSRLFWAACRAYESGYGGTLALPLVDAAVAAGLTVREARATLASAARQAGRSAVVHAGR